MLVILKLILYNVFNRKPVQLLKKRVRIGLVVLNTTRAQETVSRVRIIVESRLIGESSNDKC